MFLKTLPLLVKIPIGFIFIIFLALVVERFVFGDVHLNGGINSNGECKSDPNIVFKAELTDRSKILYIKPLGDTLAESPGRSFIVIKEGMEAPVYNPTNAILERITYSPTEGKYGLQFMASCEVTYILDNLDQLSDKLTKLAPQKNTNTNKTTPKIVIKKGELLGYVKSTILGSGFEFMLLDKSKPVSYVNSSRWQKEGALLAKCPYDYFDTRNDNNLKRDYIAYTLVNNDNIIQKKWNKEQGINQILCEDVSHDIIGTASGGWFKGESTDIKGDYLSINKYLSTVQVSIRRDGKLVEALTDYSPDTLLSEVVSGKSACYHDAKQNKWAFVKLISDIQLSFAKGNGSCPASFPQSQSTIWER